MPFQTGDVVQLKSGGPIMTVTLPAAESRDGRVWCTWFVEGKKETSGFPDAALKSAEESRDPVL
ncbi:DUF2158 domain-containing protein [Hymenobacter sp. 15J16-1T3B]|uniref:YodC family protein n=1 Tax=Hymenobacter sp. 15J16-1T3B TaxID=2886941 RepID=UPI001D10051C|nr:DUF2158 domain-containing protein [Hymenobacter sp. 15J16-1T3B]